MLTYLLAIRLKILDEQDHRSAQQAQTPSGVGLAFMLFFLSDSSGEAFHFVLPALIVVSLVGFLDDYRPLFWPLRAGVHLLCCVYVIWITDFPVVNLLGQDIDLGWFGSVLCVLGLLWLLNLYNFMDGIDGIAGSPVVCVLVLGVFITPYLDVEAVPQPIIVLFAACAGFFVINWLKALAFMGDTGIGVLGLEEQLYSLD